MPRRRYPHKAESARRIVVSFSISGLMLELFRKRLAEYMHMQPGDISKEDIRGQVRQLALQAVEDYNATPVSADPEWAEGE